MDKLKEKLTQVIDIECKYAVDNGTSHFDTCDAFGYGWDKDIWNYRHEIVDAIRKRGYSVSVQTSYGVTRFITKRNLILS